MSYRINHIPKNTPNNRRSGRPLKASTLTIHNTGNPSSTAPNERAWLTNPSNGVTASYHIVIGPETTAADSQPIAIECLPLNEVGWHAADGTKADGGNMTSIGIEICESGNYAATLEYAVQVVANMLKERGWGVDRLRRHWDWPRSSGYRKICPRLMYDGGAWTGWAEFKNRVANKMLEDEAMTPDERKEMDALAESVQELTARVEEQAAALTVANKRDKAPDWFVTEFGSSDLGGRINNPNMTKEGWRSVAIGLRAVGFGLGRELPADIR